ncbi:hypothetical protein B0H14DRAFT_2563256 [Mycena olivaceomarginata]|nr:hypothetical protein B0H14DRAFT_2563256 [Mycena olivaceomarginata]
MARWVPVLPLGLLQLWHICFAFKFYSPPGFALARKILLGVLPHFDCASTWDSPNGRQVISGKLNLERGHFDRGMKSDMGFRGCWIISRRLGAVGDGYLVGNNKSAFGTAYPSSEAGSDYEQLPSQAKEIARTEDRRRRRREEELNSPKRATPRSSAIQSRNRTSTAFQPGGALDSQTDSQQYIHNLIGTSDIDGDVFESQLVLPKKSEHESSEEQPSYNELYTRCMRAEENLDKALYDLRDTRDAIQAQRLEIVALKQALKASVTSLKQVSELIGSTTDEMEALL